MKAFEEMGWEDLGKAWLYSPNGGPCMYHDGALTAYGIVAIQDRLLGMGYDVMLRRRAKDTVWLYADGDAGFRGDTLPAALEWAVEQEGKTG